MNKWRGFSLRTLGSKTKPRRLKPALLRALARQNRSLRKPHVAASPRHVMRFGDCGRSNPYTFLSVLSRFDTSILIVLNQLSMPASEAWSMLQLRNCHLQIEFVSIRAATRSYRIAIARYSLRSQCSAPSRPGPRFPPPFPEGSRTRRERPSPDATVTAKNVETGKRGAPFTDDAGRYWLSSLAVGEYEVHVTKQGFQEAVRSGIHLAVATIATLDMAAATRTGHRTSESRLPTHRSSAPRPRIFPDWSASSR